MCLFSFQYICAFCLVVSVRSVVSNRSHRTLICIFSSLLYPYTLLACLKKCPLSIVKLSSFNGCLWAKDFVVIFICFLVVRRLLCLVDFAPLTFLPLCGQFHDRPLLCLWNHCRIWMSSFLVLLLLMVAVYLHNCWWEFFATPTLWPFYPRLCYFGGELFWFPLTEDFNLITSVFSCFGAFCFQGY